MNCNDVENLLYDFATARLDDEARESVEVHLKTCEICKGKLNTVQETLPILDYWTPPSLPIDFSVRVIEEIDTRAKPFWQKIIDKMFFPMHYKIPLEGLAVTALIFLAVIIYKGGPTPDIQTTPKGVTIETQIVRVKNPIIIETENTNSALTELLEVIKANEGSLVRREPVEEGVEVTFRIARDKEETLLEGVGQLGRVQMEKEGYKDAEGNILIILRKR